MYRELRAEASSTLTSSVSGFSRGRRNQGRRLPGRAASPDRCDRGRPSSSEPLSAMVAGGAPRRLLARSHRGAADRSAVHPPRGADCDDGPSLPPGGAYPFLGRRSTRSRTVLASFEEVWGAAGRRFEERLSRRSGIPSADARLRRVPSRAARVRRVPRRCRRNRRREIRRRRRRVCIGAVRRLRGVGPPDRAPVLDRARARPEAARADRAIPGDGAGPGERGSARTGRAGRRLRFLRPVPSDRRGPAALRPDAERTRRPAGGGAVRPPASR